MNDRQTRAFARDIDKVLHACRGIGWMTPDRDTETVCVIMPTRRIDIVELFDRKKAASRSDPASTAGA